MRKALLILALAILGGVSFGQENWGTIFFSNRNIPTASGAGGGNGDGTYHVPIWDGTPGEVGTNVTVGLFLGNALLASTPLRSVNNREFFLASAIVSVPGVRPGETATLMVRAWQGHGPFDMYGRWGEWTFQTKPLGGIPTGGGAEIPTPGMTGWGPENGRGLGIGPDGGWLWGYIGAPASSYDTSGFPLYAAPATITVYGSAIEGGNYVLTNLALYLGSQRIASQSVPPYTISATIPALPAGGYSLVIRTEGFKYSATYEYGAPVSADRSMAIRVLEPVSTMMTSARNSDGRFTFDYSVNPGLKYVISTSTDLVNWHPFVTNTPTASQASFSEANVSQGQRFYSIQRVPNP